MQNFQNNTDATAELEKLKHDLRGPLTIVQSFFDEMESSCLEERLSANQRELLVLAKRAVERMVVKMNGIQES